MTCELQAKEEQNLCFKLLWTQQCWRLIDAHGLINTNLIHCQFFQSREEESVVKTKDQLGSKEGDQCAAKPQWHQRREINDQNRCSKNANLEEMNEQQ